MARILIPILLLLPLWHRPIKYWNATTIAPPMPRQVTVGRYETPEQAEYNAIFRQAMRHRFEAWDRIARDTTVTPEIDLLQ